MSSNILAINPYAFVIQIVSFFLLWAALKRLLFDPASEVLSQREQRTTGVRAEAAKMQHDVEAMSADYDRRVLEVRRELAADLDRERAAIDQQEREVVTSAQTAAAAALATEREKMEGQATAARADLATRSRDLAALMVERVAGRKFA